MTIISIMMVTMIFVDNLDGFRNMARQSFYFNQYYKSIHEICHLHGSFCRLAL